MSVERTLLKARKSAKRGDLGAARDLYQSVLAKYPGNKRALQGLDALQHTKPPVQRPVRIGPPREELRRLMDLHERGEMDAVVKGGEAMVRAYPGSVNAQIMLGAAYTGLKRLDDAVKCYRQALRLDPNQSVIHNNLGVALALQSREKEAAACYRRAIELEPDDAEAHNNLGNMLRFSGQMNEALDCYDAALKLSPHHPDAMNNKSSVLNELGRFSEAMEIVQKAIEIEPEFTQAQRQKGQLLAETGDVEKAKEHFSRVNAAAPEDARALFQLSRVTKFESGDPQITHMARLLENKGLPDEDRQILGFALGKALIDTGDHAGGFWHLKEGNRVRMKISTYDIDQEKTDFLNIKSAFAAPVSVLEPSTPAPVTPIFIVGLPRSGTTLTEQIISGHSTVFGAGELGDLANIIKETDWLTGAPDKAKLEYLREGYLKSISEKGQGAAYVTDKMPLNFRYVGFILSAMPEAKIINLQRDARATCWSNFKVSFDDFGNGFGDDLGTVAEFYKMYRTMMDHWHNIFPGQIYDLPYEALTEDPEMQARALLDFVGLEWEPQVLEFHKSKSSVKTGSSYQMRQKIYKGSSDEWRKFARFMPELLADLDGY